MNEIYHHGIKGQKWGVRRFQNKDGSLTTFGKKRQAQFKAAAEVAKKKSITSKEDADYYKVAPEEFKNKYSGKDGWMKYLDDMYGDDWHDKDYMKVAFDVDDVKKHAIESIDSDLKSIKQNSKMMYQLYMDEAANWIQKSEKYLNTPINELTEKDFKEAKAFAKKQMKNAM